MKFVKKDIFKNMNYKNILITGGAGFVGSNLAIKLKQNYKNIDVFVLDNLKRRGSELNLKRLKENNIDFIHGDIRNKEDFVFSEKIDLMIECSAEPSVLAGIFDSPEYVINTNLIGTINCLEFARKNNVDVIFFSTSRIYPTKELNKLEFKETKTRFELQEKQEIIGSSSKGIAENFHLKEAGSFYGATKLCSELLIQEYIENYKMKAIINRCGVITGPWQMGKIDQGVAVLWMARHFWPEKKLSYIGYGGKGKQVRDLIHIDDIFEAIKIQIENIDKYSGKIFNLGGGKENSLSLMEMTEICQKISGNKIKIKSEKKDRPNDVRIYISDCSKFKKESGWKCRKNTKIIFQEIYEWIKNNKESLKNILN